MTMPITFMSNPFRVSRATAAPALLSFDQASDAREVGGKFAHQWALHRAGFKTSPFFCLSASCYRNICELLDIDLAETLATIQASDLASLRQASLKIRAAFDRVVLPERLEQGILDHFDAAFGPTAMVSVRGSMVGARASESEDSAEHAFAGMSDSFLYVTRAQLLIKLRRCWSSGFSEECLLYRAANALELGAFATAVGVQRMVFGERSFVAFAVNPHTAVKETVIVAGHGIGEGVVQERVGVDHFRLGGGQIEAACSLKLNKLVFDAEQGHGLRDAPLPEALHAAPTLSDDELHTIERDVAAVSKLFGAPQDVEGTIDAAGDIHYLQSRPVQIDHRRVRIWSNANVSESFPGTTTPLTYSFARVFYRLLNYDFYRRCGISERVLHDHRDALERLLGSLDGRIYHCISHFHETTGLNPMFGLFKSDFDRLVAELETAYLRPSEHAATWTERFRKHVLFAQVVGRTLVNFAVLDRRFAEFQAWWAALLASVSWDELPKMHPLALEHEYQRVWMQAANWWGITLINYQFMVLFNFACERMLNAWQLSDEPQLLSDLLCGDEQLVGAEIVVSVVHIAERARADAALSELLARESAEQIWSMIGLGLLPQWFEQALQVHLQRYGHRGLEELKLEQPNLRDTPWQLLSLVQKYASSSVTMESLARSEAEARARGERVLAERLRGSPLKSALLRASVRQLRKTLRRREQGRYMRSELFGYSKAVFAALGKLLCERGILEGPDDVFYLKLEEVFGILDGSDPVARPRELVRIRREDARAHAELSPRREFSSFDLLLTSVPHDTSDVEDLAHDPRQLVGLGSSGGRVRGRARVLLECSLEQRLKKSDILVARETDPGWLFLMLSVCGIVVERGSMLSHTAINGRKFGIPTVVAVRDATRRIPDGALIEIDGSTGRVKILEESAEVVETIASTP